jgi:hypothetical protein
MKSGPRPSKVRPLAAPLHKVKREFTRIYGATVMMSLSRNDNEVVMMNTDQ